MNHDLVLKALAVAQKGQRYAFATIIESTLKGTPQKAGAKMLVTEDGAIYGTIGGGRNEKKAQKECLKAIKKQKEAFITYDYFGGKGQSVCGGQIKVFIEPFRPKRDLIICGAGHIALPLSIIAKILDYNVIVVDNRKLFANKERYPHVDRLIVGPHLTGLAKLNITPLTDIMIVTQGNEYDFICLKAVIHSSAGYIGVISSKPKRIKFFNRLKSIGIDGKLLSRIQIPAGIDIGAKTPCEIAVSIAAELVKMNNKIWLGTDKFKEKSHPSTG